MRLIYIVVYDEMSFEGVPCPPYIVRGAGLQIWKLILLGYNYHNWPDKDSYSNRPGSCLISKFAFLPCVGRRADRLLGIRIVRWRLGNFVLIIIRLYATSIYFYISTSFYS
jgi:hypothetical protein